MKINYNPITNQIDYPAIVPIVWREPVDSLDDLNNISLPLDGECRYVRNENKVYQYWKEDSKWHDLGIPPTSGTGSGDMLKSVYDTDNDGIVDKAESVDDGTYSATAQDIKDAVDKKHTQNTDTYLDYGGSNQVSASEIKNHLNDTSNPHQVTASQVGINSLDDIPDGETYGRVKNTELTSGQVKQISDGTNTVTASEAKNAVDLAHQAGSESLGGDLSGTVSSATVESVGGKSKTEISETVEQRYLWKRWFYN